LEIAATFWSAGAAAPLSILSFGPTCSEGIAKGRATRRVWSK
jgi:hypothetical protein